MHFGFDDEQLAVRDTVGSLLDKQFPLEGLQQVWADGDAQTLRGLWAELAAIGVQGLLAPESAGGSGLDDVTLALVLAETGRAALPLPIAETAAVGVPLLADAGDPGGVLAGLIGGDLVLTMATGSARLAPAASLADLFIVDGALYRRREVEVEGVTSVDRTRDLGRVTPLRATSGVPLPSTTVIDRGALAAAAQLIGIGREMVRVAVDYVKQRHQFGVAIGSFQAVKHQLADAHLQMEFAAPAVWAAAVTPDDTKAVSLAKALASDAALAAGRAALQCHGAMGYTDEYRLHLWMKRAWSLAAAHGSAGWHRDRIAKELGI